MKHHSVSTKSKEFLITLNFQRHHKMQLLESTPSSHRERIHPAEPLEKMNFHFTRACIIDVHLNGGGS
jgi:hypothetical protein